MTRNIAENICGLFLLSLLTRREKDQIHDNYTQERG